VALKLTDSWLKKQPPPLTGSAGSALFWDSEVTGFGVRIHAATTLHPSGARSFFLDYRIAGRGKRFTIGSYPVWSVEAARAEARGLRKRIDRGEDPAEDKRTRREAPTVKDLAERYRAEYLPQKAEQSQRDDWAMILAEILPRLGHRRVAEIHIGDVEELHGAISRRGVPVRANRTLSVLSEMFSMSLRPAAGEIEPWRNQAEGNPCKGAKRNVEQGRERFFSEAELAAISDGLAAYGETPAANCLRFVMLTGCRPAEAMHATWDELEAEPGFWVKPSAHTKQRKAHRVPLSPAALELIERVRAERAKSPRTAKSDFVFPGQSAGEPLKQLRSAWERVTETATIALWRDAKDARVAALVAELERSLKHAPTVKEVRSLAQKAGVKLPPAPFDSRIYDLRHTFASVGAGGGLSLPIIGRLLGHTQARTTQRYAHLADDPLREAATRIATAIAGAGKGGDKVVRLDARSSGK